MLDRLLPVGAEHAGGLAKLPVDVDGGVESEVLLEPQLVFETLLDRFDPLPDRADRGL